MLGLGLSIPRCAVRAGDALTREVASILAKYGTDAHVYLPGIGVINGLTAGNYLDSAGTTAATVDNPVGLVVDSGGINAIQATTANKPILRYASGRYSWQFDGTDSLALGSVPFQMADDHCVIAGVANSLSTTGTAFAISNLAGTAYISIIQMVAGGRIIAFWKSDAAITVTCDAGSWALNENVVVSTRQTTNTRIARKNGVTNETKTTALGATTVSNSAIGVWDKTAPANYLNGRTFPIIAIKGTVSDADLLLLEKFVGALSGVTI